MFYICMYFIFVCILYLQYVTVVKSKRKKRTSLASRPCRKKPCKPTSGSDTPDTDLQAPILIHPR